MRLWSAILALISTMRSRYCVRRRSRSGAWRRGLLREQAVIDADGANPRAVLNGETVALAPGQHRLSVIAVDRAGSEGAKQFVIMGY